MDAASDQGGLVPPEERVATLSSSEGPTSYRLVGVATRDEAAGFKSPRSPHSIPQQVTNPIMRGSASHPLRNHCVATRESSDVILNCSDRGNRAAVNLSRFSIGAVSALPLVAFAPIPQPRRSNQTWPTT